MQYGKLENGVLIRWIEPVQVPQLDEAGEEIHADATASLPPSDYMMIVEDSFPPVGKSQGEWREADGQIVRVWVPVVEPVDERLTGLRGAYRDATAALCGVLGLAPVPVLRMEQIRQGSAQLQSGEAMMQALAIVTELSNLEMKLCMIDGADALERV
jgi:hypothetical protein